jgi:hypothetical protein
MNELFQVDPDLPKIVANRHGVTVPQLKFNGDHEAFFNGDFRVFLALTSANALWLTSNIVAYNGSSGTDPLLFLYDRFPTWSKPISFQFNIVKQTFTLQLRRNARPMAADNLIYDMLLKTIGHQQIRK